MQRRAYINFTRMLLPLLNLFPAEMLDCYLKELHRFSRARDLFFRQLFAGVVFHHKAFQHCHCARTTIKQMASAKYDSALHKRRPRFFSDGFISINREADLIAISQGVDLIPRPRAVKIDLLRFLVIEIINGNRIGLAVLPVHCENASPALVQKRFHRVPVDLVFPFSDWPKHIAPPFPVLSIQSCQPRRGFFSQRKSIGNRVLPSFFIRQILSNYLPAHSLIECAGIEVIGNTLANERLRALFLAVFFDKIK